MLGLPDSIRACLFDLDGVLTPTAAIHAGAWESMFNAYLRERASRDGEPFRPFDRKRDYTRYVDGRPRSEGVREFLRARGIELPDGDPADPPSAETIHGLGNRKNELMLKLLRENGIDPYEGSVRYVQAVRDAGLRCAVVSSSHNCREVLGAAGIQDQFDAIIDGETADRDALKGKPAPDTFLAAAEALGGDPGAAAVFEDALAGVEAGRSGRFGYVVGVDRDDQADALRSHGADIVVSDLAELLDTA